jgi:hypothetical protein
MWIWYSFYYDDIFVHLQAHTSYPKKAQLQFVNDSGWKHEITKTTKNTKMCVGGITMLQKLCRRVIWKILSGKDIKKINSHLRTWCQNEGGTDEWARRVQIMLLMVRILRSALPFRDEVWRQEKRKIRPLLTQYLWNNVLLYVRRSLWYL